MGKQIDNFELNYGKLLAKYFRLLSVLSPLYTAKNIAMETMQKVEWVCIDGYMTCPWCKRRQPMDQYDENDILDEFGHSLNCPRQDALRIRISSENAYLENLKAYLPYAENPYEEEYIQDLIREERKRLEK